MLNILVVHVQLGLPYSIPNTVGYRRVVVCEVRLPQYRIETRRASCRIVYFSAAEISRTDTVFVLSNLNLTLSTWCIVKLKK